MSLISWRRAQDGGSGDGRLDSAISWAGNNGRHVPVKHTAFRFCEHGGAENGETARREMSIAGRPTIKEPQCIPGGLFQQFTSSKTCHLNSESVEGVWKR